MNAILLGQFRLLLQVSYLKKAGYQEPEIQKTLAVHPYRVKLALNQCRRYGNTIIGSSLPAISRNRVRIENQRRHQRNAIGMVHPPILRPKNVIMFVIKGVDMSTITLQLNNEEERMFNEFAKYKGEELSYLLKSSLLEKIHQEVFSK